MPRPTYRSRKGWRRITIRTPGGENKVHYERRKINPPKCPICGRRLNMPKVYPKEARKGFRPPGRPYAGNICPSCLSRALKEAVRLEAGM